MSSSELDVYNPCPIDVEDIHLCEMPCVNHVLTNMNPNLYNANMFRYPNLMYFFAKIKSYDSPIFNKKNKIAVCESLNKFSTSDLRCISADLENLISRVKKERNLIYIYNINKKNINLDLYSTTVRKCIKVLCWYGTGVAATTLLNKIYMNYYLTLGSSIVAGILTAIPFKSMLDTISTKQRFNNIVSAINKSDLCAKYDAKLEGLNYIKKVVSDLLAEKIHQEDLVANLD